VAGEESRLGNSLRGYDGPLSSPAVKAQFDHGSGTIERHTPLCGQGRKDLLGRDIFGMPVGKGTRHQSEEFRALSGVDRFRHS
jgi:hypothetical protein